MGSSTTPQLELWLAEEWAGYFAHAITSMTAESPQVKCKPASPPTEIIVAPDYLWWQQSFTPPLEAVLWVGAAGRTWEAIGKRILSSAGIADSSTEDAKGAYQEVLNQSLSGIAQALASRLRKDVVCGLGSRDAPIESTIPAFSIALVFPDVEVQIDVAFTPGLLKPFELPEKPRERPTLPAAQPNASKTPENHAGKSIDLLLDVELPVSISFGRAQLPLKDVIKLTTGSIVELDRTVSEPVEVIVNNCVIARGQVVVVEGNFGIRIEHVMSRQERLRTLK